MAGSFRNFHFFRRAADLEAGRLNLHAPFTLSHLKHRRGIKFRSAFECEKIPLPREHKNLYAMSMIEKQDLFEARTDGYWTYRIPGIAVKKTILFLSPQRQDPARVETMISTMSSCAAAPTGGKLSDRLSKSLTTPIMEMGPPTIL